MAFCDLDENIRTELEAAAFRRLLTHLGKRTDAKNVDLMNLAGFCRNCMSNWLQEAAEARSVALTRDEARAYVYGMPYEDWVERQQTETAPAGKGVLKEAFKNHR